MEVDQIQYKHQSSTNGNVGRITSTKILSQNQKMDYHYPDEEEEEEGGGHEHKTGAPDSSAYGRFYGWPSSRIVRVSRASGGKDRHSKVLTSKGLRDRRVRLSVNTAIQFYDLQDRLGYDQPSKAVEWLLKAAASSIEELPPMNPPFPDTPKQIMSDEKRSSITAGSDGAAADPSSTSETSKSSSRSETRVKARERAKGRVLAEKENKEKENESSHNPSSFNAINRTSSFTELLNGGMNSRQWFSPPMDYFTNGFSPPLATAGGGHSSELHHFSFGPDNYGSSNGSGEYNLNFSISSANSAGVFAGYNRGNLQSNSSPSPSLLRFSSPPDGSHENFFMGGASGAEVENHHQFLSGFYYQKGKGKN